MNGLPADVASFVAKLEQAYPEFRIVGPLLARRDASLLAFECVAHELVQATFHLPEISVATGKLTWWGEELARWAKGEARHPLTRRVNPRGGDGPDLRLVDGLIDAAIRHHDAAPPADHTAQVAAAAPAFVSIERLRVAMLGTPEAAIAPQADLAVATHLLRELARVPLTEEVSVSAIPMHQLARHQLTRAELAAPGAARDAVARAQLADIAAMLAGMQPAIDGVGGWMARVRRRCEQWRSRPLGRGDAFAQLWGRLDRAPWNTVWLAWTAQRRGP
ncbi:MAG TPA: hypothetical protein VLF18_21725 [Tahibacter sp.]|uniref:hypothetical protein n=1 Tax=Tahibacter sp. TaxID=2056211 RepID=UPI002CA7C631|nr:hypothetical protein [Tahibacter sp.]HSX62812.1 hypothetical protein [Tahibacter sp.]